MREELRAAVLVVGLGKDHIEQTREIINPVAVSRREIPYFSLSGTCENLTLRNYKMPPSHGLNGQRVSVR